MGVERIELGLSSRMFAAICDPAWKILLLVLM